MKKNSLTSDVMDQLLQKVKSGTINGKYDLSNLKKFKTGKTKLTVIFTGTDYGLNESLAQLVDGKNNYGFSYNIGFSFSGARVIGEREIECIIDALKPDKVYFEEDQLIYEEVLSESEGIIVPMMTQDTTTKLSLAIVDSFVSNLLWHGLWIGKPILIDFKNVIKYKGKKAVSPIQENIIKKRIESLIELGVEPMEEDGYIPKMLNRFKNMEVDLKEKQITEKKIIENSSLNSIPKILTSKDLLELVGNDNSIIVPSKTIVTPLALDTAKEKGIKIIKEQ